MTVTELRPGRVETVDVTCLIDGLEEPLRIPFATNNPNTELLLATGFGEANVAQIADSLGKRGISVAVYNIESPAVTERPEAIIEQILLQGTAAAVHTLNQGAGRRIETPVIGVGQSRGSFEQIVTACNDPSLWKLLIESASFGLNNDFFGEDFKTQRKELNRRLRATGLLIPKPPEDSTVTNIDISYVALMRGLTASFKYGVKQNGAAMVNKLRQLDLMYHVFVGADDPLVRPDELEQKFGKEGFVVQLPGAGHESLVTKAGIDYIAKVIELGLSKDMRQAVE